MAAEIDDRRTEKKVTIKRNRNRPTAEQITGFQGIPTGFVVDALFGCGAMDLSICPVGDGRDINCVAAGPALTAGSGPADILALSAALNFIQPGDIMISAFDGHQGCAAAGDRVMGMLKNAGGAGFVTDGPVRDYKGIVEVGLPAWCTGLTPASPFSSGPGTVGMPVQIAGQQVCSGDMIIADRDGVVVVPFDRIDEVLKRLDSIKKLEIELDAKVAAGQKIFPKVLDMLDGDDVEYMD